MSVGIIHNEDGAVLYCTTSDWAFGPLFRSVEHAVNFLEWLRRHPHPYQTIPILGPLLRHGIDPREFDQSNLETIVSEWRRANCDSYGRLKEHNTDE